MFKCPRKPLFPTTKYFPSTFLTRKVRPTKAKLWWPRRRSWQAIIWQRSLHRINSHCLQRQEHKLKPVTCINRTCPSLVSKPKNRVWQWVGGCSPRWLLPFLFQLLAQATPLQKSSLGSCCQITIQDGTIQEGTYSKITVPLLTKSNTHRKTQGWIPYLQLCLSAIDVICRLIQLFELSLERKNEKSNMYEEIRAGKVAEKAHSASPLNTHKGCGL